jgi:cytochrome b561
MSAVTEGRSASSFRYDRTTISLHWLVVALVALQWVGGRTIDWFPKGSLKIDARSVHIVLGCALAAVLAFRLYWKAGRSSRPPSTAGERWRVAAVAVHWALLSVLVGLVILGLTLEGLRGDSLFNLAKLPALGPYGPDQRHLLANQATTLHGLAANLILMLAGLHAAAALFHHLVRRDGVLRRML